MNGTQEKARPRAREFHFKLRDAWRDGNEIGRLKRLLKAALRAYGFRNTDQREIVVEEGETSHPH